MIFPVQGIAISRLENLEMLEHTEVLKIFMTSLLPSGSEE